MDENYWNTYMHVTFLMKALPYCLLISYNRYVLVMLAPVNIHKQKYCIYMLEVDYIFQNNLRQYCTGVFSHGINIACFMTFCPRKYALYWKIPWTQAGTSVIEIAFNCFENLANLSQYLKPCFLLSRSLVIAIMPKSKTYEMWMLLQELVGNAMLWPKRVRDVSWPRMCLTLTEW